LYKIRQSWSFRCGDIKIFQFFKMAAIRHLGFVWGHIWTIHSDFGISITLQNLILIDAVFL